MVKQYFHFSCADAVLMTNRNITKCQDRVS